MNSCSENNLDDAASNKLTARLTIRETARKFYPTIYFAVFLIGGEIWRASVGGSAPLDLAIISGAAIATLLVANQRLPMQNLVGLLATIVVFWWATLLIAKMSGVFFFPPLFRFQFVRDYELGLFWVIGMINARGISKLVLTRWRKNNGYGFWLIGLSSLLVTIEDPEARRNFIYFVEKLLFAALVFASATPWFIDKKNVKEMPDYQPLILTILLLLW